MNQIDRLKTAIIEVRNFHAMISSDFPFKEDIPNLSRKYIRDVVNVASSSLEPTFLKLIINYQELITKALIESNFEFDFSDLDFRSRVKQRDSIVNKMQYYVLQGHEGKVAINKCLNDLLGFRITVDVFDHDNNDLVGICDEMKSEYNYKIACINSCKESYQGSHIYIYGDNFSFPWELQIWRREDAVPNEKSHSEHKAKREYIQWPKQYVESSLDSNGGE